MASAHPTWITPTGTSHSPKKPRQTDAQLVSAVTEQLQVQIHGNGLLPQEVREYLDKLSTILAAPKELDESGVILELSQRPMGTASTKKTKKRKATNKTSWIPNDAHLRKRQCNIAPSHLSATSNCNAQIGPQDKGFTSRALPRKLLNRSPYSYRAQYEGPWVSRISRQLKAFHMCSEEEHMQEVTHMSLPPLTNEEMLLCGSLTPLPEPSAEEIGELSSNDEGSSDGSDVPSFCSSPRTRPTTPDTNISSCSSPQDFAASPKPPVHIDMDGKSEYAGQAAPATRELSTDGTSSLSGTSIDTAKSVPHSGEAVKSEPVKDEDMFGADEDLQGISIHDELMNGVTEVLPASPAEDEDMANASEDPQPTITEDVDMAFTQDDSSMPGQMLQEPSQDSAMEDVSTKEMAQGDSQSSTPTSTSGTLQGDQEMEGVETTISTPSSNTTSGVNDQSEPIWDELSNLGRDLHIDLQRGDVQDSIVEVEPYLHDHVWEHVNKAQSSDGLILLLKWRHRQGVLSLQQVSVLRDCVEQARARDAATQDDDMQDASPAAHFQNLPMPPPEPPREERVHSHSFFSDVPQQRHLPVRLSPQMSDEDAPHAERLLTLLYKAFSSIDGHCKSLKRFAAMFNMPWHNPGEMKRIVQNIIQFKTRGSKNSVTAESFVDHMSTRNAPDVLYICASCVHATGCELGVADDNVHYQARRQDYTAHIFQSIAGSNFQILKAQNDDGCLSWQGIQELASREEGAFFHQRKTLTELGIKFYQSYIKERVLYWKDPQQLRNYIEHLNGHERLTVGKYMFSPSTATKRVGGDLDSDGDDNDHNTSSMQPRPLKRRKATPAARLGQANMLQTTIEAQPGTASTSATPTQTLMTTSVAS